MANKQTAVDYFFDKIKSNFEHDGDKLESVMFLYAICKEKEREQHENTWIDSRMNDKGDSYIGKQISFEQYYNDTYGNNRSDKNN